MVPASLFYMGKIIVEDKSHIKNIVFKYPDIMSEGAKYMIQGTLMRETEIKNKLWELRKEIYSLEEELKGIESFKTDLRNLYTLEYESKEIQVIKEECNILVNNKDDYRNK